MGVHGPATGRADKQDLPVPCPALPEQASGSGGKLSQPAALQKSLKQGRGEKEVLLQSVEPEIFGSVQ